MIDSDIKRSITLDFNKKEANFLLTVPLEGLLSTEESWNMFGQIAKAEMQIDSILELMAEMIRVAKR